MSSHASFSISGFFNRDMAEAYDRRNHGLKPISDCLHFLMRLVLTRLPQRARVLCVGVGTGAEVLSLAAERPDWSFVGIDPSAEMLEVGRRRLNEAGILERCQLIQGYVEDVPDRNFDAAMGVLVAHFIQLENRPAFYRAIHDRLKPGGTFVSAEITGDPNGPEFLAMLDDWKQVQRLMGATEQSLETLDEMLRNKLGVLSTDSTEALWREAGFSLPVPFFRAFMIHGWHAQRPLP
jgi:tRNA (cmo5U34)-methyltransferase